MAKYYDYHLIDATDAPYATFRFHYRSWENLRLLHLAPSGKSHVLRASPSTTTDTELDNFGFDFSTSTRGRRRETTSSRPISFNVARLAGARIERPLPELPVTCKHHSGTKNECTKESKIQENEITDDPSSEDTLEEAQERHVQRERKILAAPKSSAMSNVSIAKSLQAYADGEDGLLVDTMEFGSAIKLETVFHGKATETTSPTTANPDQCSTMPNDDVFLGMRDKAPQESHAPPFERLALSPLKTRPKTIYAAPFTDSLRKREMAPLPQSPTRHRNRRVSHDPSSESQGSAKQRRAHGGSLDSRYRSLLDDGLTMEA